ncbi:hypothetical protein M2451_003340 [Dysgonomonas sp. PFB1-18]|uniref:hypothetical protein n=1 Tax=unclassified Dysgonomonas TaxID=2630389 RepID=UPI0024740F4F|nr:MULTISPECIES: hypothetical protein [unclassified Dysgonomonas]MDH6310570.1 hypothetical protein [Dysgonomonas sp. PF1-14]MDH6340420.1 hypothetical protein [Dysgonomonas sp. PF1-16]MDH6382000.1 hypothetical protein [Dysgonomonas sp. PFB1-18]MDH6399391.1 hypothetical protein [Dysgonomonas sp. PF1-23]
MIIGRKKIELKAGIYPKSVNVTPQLLIHANKNKPKWQDWAIEIGWFVWAVGLRVETI